MKILKLRLRGSIGIKKGLGLDEIVLDLSNLSGLIALSGDNGNGKTTVLEMLQPYAQMASRKGKLQDHFFLRDSEKEFVFNFQGDHYKTLIKIDAETSRAEGFIWKNKCPHSEVDGKISNYKKYIFDLMGSPELFFNSIFCAQNSDKLSDMRPGDLKSLFSEFLRLDRLVEYEDTAKQCTNVLTGKTEELNREIEALKLTADSHDQSTKDLSGLITNRDSCEQNVLSSSKNLEALKVKLSGAKDKMQSNKLIAMEIEGLQSNLDRLSAEIKQDQDQSEAELDSIDAKSKNIDLEIFEMDSLLANENEIVYAAGIKKELEAAISKDKDLLASATKNFFNASQLVSEKEKELSEFDLKSMNDINSANHNKTRLSGKIKEIMTATLSKKEAESAKISSKFASLIFEAEQRVALLKTKLKTCEGSIEDLNKRDSVLAREGEPECKSKACPFISTALAAQEASLKIATELSDCRHTAIRLKKEYSDTLKRISAEIEHLKRPEVVDDLPEAKHLAEITASIGIMEAAHHTGKTIFESEIESLKKDATGMKAEKEAIETRLLESGKKFDEVKLLAHSFDKVKTAAAEKQRLKKLLDENATESERIKMLFKKRIAPKKAQLTEIDAIIRKKEAEIDDTAEPSFVAADRMICETKDYIETLKHKISTYEKGIALKEKEVVEKEQAQSEIKAKTEKRKLLIKEVSDWKYLKDACSANGLRALEINSVAPIITGYANNLLVDTFGPNATVNLRTQDDEGREILDIQIFDEDGDKVSLNNRSGGQQIWALKAMRLSMTLINKEKSGKDFGSLLSDEETGPLDNENALKYIMLYRTFMRHGDFDTCFYITHNTNCIKMADHVIGLKWGKIVIS